MCDYNDFNVNTLEKYLEEIKNIEILHYYLHLKKFEFTNRMIHYYRLSLIPQVSEFIISHNTFKQEKLKLSSDTLINYRKGSYADDNNECNVEWPNCLYDTDYKYVLYDYNILRIDQKHNFIDNYFFNYCKGCNQCKPNYQINYELLSDKELNDILIEKEKNLLMERKQHKCYKLKENVEINFDSIPNFYIDDIFEDQEFTNDDNETRDSFQKEKLLKRQGKKCNYLQLNQGGKI